MDDGSASVASNWAAAPQGPQSAPGQQMFPCPGCGQWLPWGTLACPHCHALVYRDRLQQLAQEAMQLEQTDPARAAMIWQQCLALLPLDSQQYAAVYQRIGALAGGWVPSRDATGANPHALEYGARPRENDPWPLAVAKTIGSMGISVLVYAVMFHPQGADALQSLLFAVGFVLLMLVHEMGHVIAMWHYKLSASPPIFIPFVGALINLRQNPPNAKVEAVVGIGGPVLGTIGAIVCYALYLFAPGFHNEGMLLLSSLGFFLNAFNLIPMPPLDGGRVMAAISPWIWLAGLLAIVALFVKYLLAGHISFILLLIVFFALPRMRQTLASRGRNLPYYKISRGASWTIGLVYLALAGVLSVLLWQTNAFARWF